MLHLFQVKKLTGRIYIFFSGKKKKYRWNLHAPKLLFGWILNLEYYNYL
jgi:hypothetical protein